MPEATAHLAGELGVLAFTRGYAAWIDGGCHGEDGLVQHTAAVSEELRTASAALS